MPEKIRLDEALEGIMDGIVNALEQNRGPGNDLEEVKTIVCGDRSRPAPQTPAVWVRALTASCDHSQRSYAEKWQVEIIILAIVKNNQPEDGYREATSLAARARSVVLRDRTLGKRAYVQDVRSGNFEMGGPNLQNESLFASTATIQVHFVILENNP